VQKIRGDFCEKRVTKDQCGCNQNFQMQHSQRVAEKRRVWQIIVDCTNLGR
jgi:hypothetical protein